VKRRIRRLVVKFKRAWYGKDLIAFGGSEHKPAVQRRKEREKR
jgi:hypothetical protein